MTEAPGSARSAWAWLLAGLALLLLASCALAEIAVSRGNTLAAGGRWHSAKEDLQRPLTAGCQFGREPVALARNRLDMSAFHAYNEIWFHRSAPIERWAMQVELREHAVLAVFIERDDDRARGFLLKLFPEPEVGTVSVLPSGAFEQLDMEPAPELVQGEYSLEVRIEGEQAELSVDGRPLAVQTAPPPNTRTIGLRSGFGAVIIDDVVLEGAFPDSPLSESFRGPGTARWYSVAMGAAVVLWLALVGLVRLQWLPRRVGTALVALYLALELGLLLLIGAVPGPWAGPEPLVIHGTERAIEILAAFLVCKTVAVVFTALVLAFAARRGGTAALVALLCGGLCVGAWSTCGAQVQFLSGAHLRWARPLMVDGCLNTTAPPSEVLAEIVARYRDPPPPDVRRILFVGGSQTWGSGASSDQAGVVARIESMLAERDPTPGVRYQTVNGAVGGLNSLELRPFLEQHWLDLHISVVVANLGFNDEDETMLAEGLPPLIDACQRQGIPVLLSLEPSTFVVHNRSLEKHRIMRDIAGSWGVPIAEPQAAIPPDHQVGFLWWDFVHMTDHGQELLAQAIYPALEQLILDLERGEPVQDYQEPPGPP